MCDPEIGMPHDPENLQFLAQIPQHLLPQIETMQPAPSDFLFDASDSMFAGRTLGMSIWAVHNEQQARDREPRQDSTLLALHYPFTICGVPIVRYYSFDAGEKIWFFCQTIAQKYGIETHGYGKLDMHPIHRLLECCFACNRKPAPLILTIPVYLNNRQQYLVWIELFMREIYELLLDESFKSLGTTCWDLAFGYLKHNAFATGTFQATAIVRPITGWGRTFKDDFAVAEFTDLPRKKMAVVIRTTYRWMVNRHTNARPAAPELVDHVGEVLRGTESDEDCKDTQDSEAESEEPQPSESESVRTLRILGRRDSESEFDSETDTLPIEPATEGSESDSESYENHDDSDDSQSKSEVFILCLFKLQKKGSISLSHLSLRIINRLFCHNSGHSNEISSLRCS